MGVQKELSVMGAWIKSSKTVFRASEKKESREAVTEITLCFPFSLKTNQQLGAILQNKNLIAHLTPQQAELTMGKKSGDDGAI